MNIQYEYSSAQKKIGIQQTIYVKRNVNPYNAEIIFL